MWNKQTLSFILGGVVGVAVPIVIAYTTDLDDRGYCAMGMLGLTGIYMWWNGLIDAPKT